VALWRDALRSQTLQELLDDGVVVIVDYYKEAVGDFIAKKQR
jgi:hypothetical protein